VDRGWRAARLGGLASSGGVGSRSAGDLGRRGSEELDGEEECWVGLEMEMEVNKRLGRGRDGRRRR
jgi:hypothetical protein